MLLPLHDNYKVDFLFFYFLFSWLFQSGDVRCLRIIHFTHISSLVGGGWGGGISFMFYEELSCFFCLWILPFAFCWEDLTSSWKVHLRVWSGSGRLVGFSLTAWAIFLLEPPPSPSTSTFLGSRNSIQSEVCVCVCVRWGLESLWWRWWSDTSSELRPPWSMSRAVLELATLHHRPKRRGVGEGGAPFFMSHRKRISTTTSSGLFVFLRLANPIYLFFKTFKQLHFYILKKLRFKFRTEREGKPTRIFIERWTRI